MRKKIAIFSFIIVLFLVVGLLAIFNLFSEPSVLEQTASLGEEDQATDRVIEIPKDAVLADDTEWIVFVNQSEYMLGCELTHLIAFEGRRVDSTGSERVRYVVEKYETSETNERFVVHPNEQIEIAKQANSQSLLIYRQNTDGTWQYTSRLTLSSHPGRYTSAEVIERGDGRITCRGWNLTKKLWEEHHQSR